MRLPFVEGGEGRGRGGEGEGGEGRGEGGEGKGGEGRGGEGRGGEGRGGEGRGERKKIRPFTNSIALYKSTFSIPYCVSPTIMPRYIYYI